MYHEVDTDHVMVYVDLTSAGKYAEADAYSDESGVIEVSLCNNRGDEPVCAEDSLEIHLEGEWEVFGCRCGRYTIYLTLRRSSARDSDDYWTEAVTVEGVAVN